MNIDLTSSSRQSLINRPWKNEIYSRQDILVFVFGVMYSNASMEIMVQFEGEIEKLFYWDLVNQNLPFSQFSTPISRDQDASIIVAVRE